MLLAARIAIAFLTILPVRLPAELPADGLKRSAGFFPLAGWLIGGFLAGGAWICVWAGLPPLVSAVLLVALGAWLTRGLHLDGLADLLDGLGGGQTPERRLAIMKDSAIGAFGVIGLVVLLVLKVACLAALLANDEEPLFFALFAAPVAARWAMATLACGVQYPRASRHRPRLCRQGRPGGTGVGRSSADAADLVELVGWVDYSRRCNAACLLAPVQGEQGTGRRYRRCVGRFL